jgi:hypothetical protein
MFVRYLYSVLDSALDKEAKEYKKDTGGEGSKNVHV